MKSETRVRFAPSPTGTLHLGSARTALFNWLYARHSGGKFILRIEDTDRERSAEEFEKAIIHDLRWLGLDWDEGPFAGGEHGPYHQSLRTETYLYDAERLSEAGLVYRCYCTEEELERERQGMLAAGVMPKYSGKCRGLTEARCAEMERSGLKPAIRFRVPKREIIINDLIRGQISFSSDVIGDFIIIRSDGVASFNFAVVVDDADMRITHIIRGEDHLTNTARHVLLFEALGYKLPEFAHISMLFGTDGAKLSKRHGATSVSEFREMGYAPDAILNYLATLGWSAESAREVFTIAELIEEYCIDRMSKSPSIFDVDKLKWLNGQHIRMMDDAELASWIEPYLAGLEVIGQSDQPDKLKVTRAIKTSLELFTDAPSVARMFFEAEPLLERDAEELLSSSSIPEIAKSTTAKLQSSVSFSEETAMGFLKELAGEFKPRGITGKMLFLPLRAALTGRLSGPDLHFILEIFGPQKCVNRLSRYIKA